MQKFIIKGGKSLKGNVKVSGAKNAALKALVAACLTEEKVTIHNIPLISDLHVMLDILKDLGAEITLENHTVSIELKEFNAVSIPLEKAALVRTSSMLIGPLLARTGEAIIPNPGGCRLGARPIDRTVEGISTMNVDITYHSEDGYFHAQVHGDNLGKRPIERTLKGLEDMGAEINYNKTKRQYHAKTEQKQEGQYLKATNYTFEKNTHTGTETMILSAVLAEGKTILDNAAQEPEIDELIKLLNCMGAKVKRVEPRKIEIEGVKRLHSAEYTIEPDRNDVVTFAIAAIVTKGDIFIEGAKKEYIKEFLQKLDEAGGGYEEKNDGIRFYYKGPLKAVDVTTAPHPGFMTDWQAPWGVLMTQATGKSIIHETVFENKMGYIHDLKKMGAKAELFNPTVANPEQIYNFNLADDHPEFFHAVIIEGPTKLHNAVVSMKDIRAGAAVVIAALAASGTSTIFDIEKLDRGYENFDQRVAQLGADIKRVEGE